MSTVTTANKQAAFRRFAACRDEDPEVFFPVGTTGPAFLQIEDARSVCMSCPLMASCADEALTNGETDGVWGGLSEADRSWLRRRAREELGAGWGELTRTERDALLARLTRRLRIAERGRPAVNLRAALAA